MELIDGGQRGWRVGDFFCSRDRLHMGAVLRVQDWGVIVLWDDWKVGHLVWDPAAPNHIDTVKQLGLYNNLTLRDRSLLELPTSTLWAQVSKMVYMESWPTPRRSEQTVQEYLGGL